MFGKEIMKERLSKFFERNKIKILCNDEVFYKANKEKLKELFQFFYDETIIKKEQLRHIEMLPQYRAVMNKEYNERMLILKDKFKSLNRYE